MGIGTSEVLRSRRVRSRRRVEQLVAHAEAGSSSGRVRQARIEQAVRVVRRQQRLIEAARGTIATAETVIGEALLRLVEGGLSRNEAFARAGLQRHHGRRYLGTVTGPQPWTPGHESTLDPALEHDATSGLHRDRRSALPDATD